MVLFDSNLLFVAFGAKNRLEEGLLGGDGDVGPAVRWRVYVWPLVEDWGADALSRRLVVLAVDCEPLVHVFLEVSFVLGVLSRWWSPTWSSFVPLNLWVLVNVTFGLRLDYGIISYIDRSVELFDVGLLVVQSSCVVDVEFICEKMCVVLSSTLTAQLGDASRVA